MTPTSYLVLGMLASWGPSTPYDLKRYVAGSLGHFWSFPHAQLYSEPERLVAAGLVSERREETGRRRRTFRITRAGRTALARWLAEPTAEATEIRDLALLKLFFGEQGGPDDVARLARAQEAAHREKLATYRALDDELERQGIHSCARRTLQLGLAYEKTVVAFWRGVAEDA